MYPTPHQRKKKKRKKERKTTVTTGRRTSTSVLNSTIILYSRLVGVKKITSMSLTNIINEVYTEATV